MIKRVGRAGGGKFHAHILPQSEVEIINRLTITSSNTKATDLAVEHRPGSAPGILFCSGFKSSMQGNKVQNLHEYCAAKGWQFTGFDYRGHGSSGGRFEDCCITDWVEDACAVFDQVCTGPQIVVGSSMGAWIGLRLAQQRTEHIAGFLGIASAPDFTERLIWQNLPQPEQEHLMSGGSWCLPSNSDDVQDYRINYRLIQSGRDNSVLKQPLKLPFPVHLLHGTGDQDVPWQLSEELLQHLDSPDACLSLCKGIDHRFSGEPQLEMIRQRVTQLRASHTKPTSTSISNQQRSL